jgi:hypothetical protein
LSGFIQNITGDSEIYHIYAKGQCLYNCLNESEFKEKWAELNAMVGLMHTDYNTEDLSYEKISAGIGGGGGTVTWSDPPGDDSY